MSQRVEETLLALLSQVRDAESINPNDVAKALGTENWNRQLPKVRGVIIAQAKQGKIEILRKGKPVSHEGLKGIFRIRLAAAE